MCGRYVLTSPADAIAEHFALAAVPDLAPRYNIAPTQLAPVLRRDRQGERELVLLRWGLVPMWAKDLSIGTRMINARAESVASKPGFRWAYQHRRCLIPADGFYEWKPGPVRKQPYFCHLPAGGLLAIAGLWEQWKSPDGEVLQTYTIVTTDANADVRALHDRMPAIVLPEHYDAWLSGPDPSALLAPVAAGTLMAEPVSTRVNNVRNDDASLVAPIGVAFADDV